VGSVEYHGPHGPFGTDLTLSEGFAERVANRTGALLFPAVAYTFVPRLTREHGAAVSVAPDVFLAYLCEVLRGVTAFGPKRVMIVNGHSENQYALRLAAETVTEEMPEASILLVNWWQWTPEGACRSDGEGGTDPWGENHGNGHGGPLELSVTAAFDAKGVSVPASDADVAYEAPWWRGRAQVVGLGQSPHGFAGYHGLVSAIDVGRGRRVVEGVTEALTTLANGWLARVHPDG
jgi:creatinine amidohydrolase